MKPSEIQNLYERLGVDRNADEDSVKSAYRRLAREWHPDMYPGDDEIAKEEFIAISEAYEVLSDAGHRRRYDLGGYDSGTFTRTPTYQSSYPGMDLEEMLKQYEEMFKAREEMMKQYKEIFSDLEDLMNAMGGRYNKSSGPEGFKEGFKTGFDFEYLNNPTFLGRIGYGIGNCVGLVSFLYDELKSLFKKKEKEDAFGWDSWDSTVEDLLNKMYGKKTGNP